MPRGAISGQIDIDINGGPTSTEASGWKSASARSTFDPAVLWRGPLDVQAETEAMLGAPDSVITSNPQWAWGLVGVEVPASQFWSPARGRGIFGAFALR